MPEINSALLMETLDGKGLYLAATIAQPYMGAWEQSQFQASQKKEKNSRGRNIDRRRP